MEEIHSYKLKTHYRPKLSNSYLSISSIVLFAFSSVFFPRILDSIGFPSPINFCHFLIIPSAFCVALVKSRTQDLEQVRIGKLLIANVFFLLWVELASALLNSAGLINSVLSFLLLVEPFLLLVALILIPFSFESFQRFKTIIVTFFWVHIFFVFVQKVLVDLGLIGFNGSLYSADAIQGVFYLSFGGHVVSGFVSASFAAYYLLSEKNKASSFLRISIAFLVLSQILISDAKQVVLVVGIAWILLSLVRSGNIGKAIIYTTLGLIVGFLFYWSMYNLPIFKAYTVWIRPELYGPDGAAVIVKTHPLRVITSYYTSGLNWLLGLGPGHTAGRLGGWMLWQYSGLLTPLGATTHPASGEIWAIFGEGYAWLDSSIFSPFWGWVGIWGDLGFLGLLAYLWLVGLVWICLCKDDFSRFSIIMILVNGFIFTLLEEPGYMNSVMMLIGLRWHESRFENRRRSTAKLLAVTKLNGSPEYLSQ